MPYLLLTQHIGEDPAIIEKLLSGTHPFSQRLKAARRPMVVVGSALLSRPDGGLLYARLQQLAHQVRGSVVFMDLSVNLFPVFNFSV